MSESAQTKITPQPILKTTTSTEVVHKTIAKRQSKELVLALCGPIGSGVRNVKDQLAQVIKDEGYEVIHIRVSELMEQYLEKKNQAVKYEKSSRVARYTSLMDAGNLLRETYGETIGADLSISKISTLRQGKNGSSDITADKEIALTKRAYIIDQLKHPKEVHALRNIYGNIFYLIGVLCDETRRCVGLEQEGISKQDAHNLIMRDKSENDEYGQHLEDTLFHADFFINNSNPNSSSTQALFERFMKLIHGGRGVTPTQEEYGMYAAYSASMQSACLSRQVGASILDEDGNVLAVGRNDVPKFGGGLYTEDDNISPNTKDFRCIHKDQQCHNDLHKTKLKLRIQEIISDELREPLAKANIKIDFADMAKKIVSKSQIKSLIEYSRAIHAEMDAILSITRQGIGVPKGATLYTTTFPCHNCARHIVAAGIEKVKYIQPYEKSLALALHDDTLSLANSKDKVHLAPFQGVAPSRYQVFFINTSAKKDGSGKLIITDKDDRLQVDPEFVDSYIQRELKVAASIFEPN